MHRANRTRPPSLIGRVRSPGPRRPGADVPVAPGRRDHRPAHARRPEAAPALPGTRQLADADLAAEQSTADGRCHLVDGAHLAAELAGPAGVPRIRALCTHEVRCGSLTADQGPVCRRCLDVAGPRLEAAARERASRERAALPARVARLLAFLQRAGAHRSEIVPAARTGTRRAPRHVAGARCR